jgi:hypothetical protein
MEIQDEINSPVTLQEIIELTKGIDPSKVVIDIKFEVPDWTWLVITTPE